MLQYSRLDAQWGSSREDWRLAGTHGRNITRRFEALAYVAGEKLKDTRVVSTEQHRELLSEPNPVLRWYKALQNIGQDFRYASTWRELDENDTIVGYVYTGSIYRPAESSSILCLELSTRYPEGENQQSFFRKLWDKYTVPIIMAVVAGVITAIIIAFLQI